MSRVLFGQYLRAFFDIFDFHPYITFCEVRVKMRRSPRNLKITCNHRGLTRVDQPHVARSQPVPRDSPKTRRRGENLEQKQPLPLEKDWLPHLASRMPAARGCRRSDSTAP